MPPRQISPGRLRLGNGVELSGEVVNRERIPAMRKTQYLFRIFVLIGDIFN